MGCVFVSCSTASGQHSPQHPTEFRLQSSLKIHASNSRRSPDQRVHAWEFRRECANRRQSLVGHVPTTSDSCRAVRSARTRVDLAARGMQLPRGRRIMKCFDALLTKGDIGNMHVVNVVTRQTAHVNKFLKHFATPVCLAWSQGPGDVDLVRGPCVWTAQLVEARRREIISLHSH